MWIEDYMILCRTRGVAISLSHRLAAYLNSHEVENLRFHKRERVITCNPGGTIVKIRFVAYEEIDTDNVCRGFRGSLRTASEVDKFLDPWEKEQARNALKERFGEIF